ncbi:MAG TPA: response regulator [Ktedonobacteraceae bacterium]|jgi:CheY-like chemotaxis protein|nr:response regulator [Ktedonobacteraceae bacterium]
MIMVVDDDEPIRNSLRLLLMGEGYQVETASDGGDALKKLGIVKPKVILLDIMMTPIDGLAFLKTLKEKGLQKNYAIFVMTAMTGIVDELKEMQSKGIIRDFMIKPFVFSDRLLEEIHHIVTT